MRFNFSVPSSNLFTVNRHLSLFIYAVFSTFLHDVEKYTDK